MSIKDGASNTTQVSFLPGLCVTIQKADRIKVFFFFSDITDK